MMKEVAATVTSKGQVTIPVEVRRHLHMAKNDTVLFILRSDGGVELKLPKYPNVDSLVGAAGSLKEPMTWEEMRDAAREERIRERFLDK